MDSVIGVGVIAYAGEDVPVQGSSMFVEQAPHRTGSGEYAEACRTCFHGLLMPRRANDVLSGRDVK
jgi:hypothetical protein